jgi:tyrosyl-tRNA synthetase
MKGRQIPKDLLTRGIVDLVDPNEDFRNKLETNPQGVVIKFGIDPTRPDIHLGHTVMHRKVRDFQELGHSVVLIIGDYTVLVGDHSDKLDMRKERNVKDIEKDLKGYEDQFFMTVLKKGTKIMKNSTWLKKLNFGDVIGLAKQFSVAQLLDRETFLIRYKGGKAIGLDEFLYPLMQGYDSVSIGADIELGATDQTFNILAGRVLTQSMSKKGQQCGITMKLLLGSDGRPMGKSLENYIPLKASPDDMYGKIMSIADSVMFDYFELITRIPMKEIEQMKIKVASGENPMQFKKILAHNVVSFYHGEEKAKKASESFTSTFSKKEIPADAKKIKVKIGAPLVDILIKNGFVASKSEFRRLVEEGAITFKGHIEEKKIIDPASLVSEPGALKIGKRRFLHIDITKNK